MQRKRIALLLALVLLGACTHVKRCSYEGFGRDDWQHPERVVAALGLEPGDRVVDLGAGSGYFTFRLAEAVGPAGRVEAVDIDPDMIAYLDERIASGSHGNVRTVLATPSDPGLEGDDVDLVFTVNTYHHMEDREAYFAGLARYLAPDGRVAVIDLQESGQGFFFRLFLGSHTSDPAVIASEMAAAGYRRVESHDFLTRQSFQVFARADAAAPEPAPEAASVRPGINAPFLSPELDVAEWTRRFEGESREIYVERERIADTLCQYSEEIYY